MSEKNSEQDEKQKNDTQQNDKPSQAEAEAAPVEREHSLTLGDQTLAYKTHTGMMPLKNAKGEVEANIFYMAYTRSDVAETRTRPLTFVFNGGPGSSSVWLHLGAFGPQRVRMEDEGWMPAPPYTLEPNAHTLLDETDMVFIDPVGTGYSRATDPDNNKKYWSVQGDLDSVGEFIRLYLTRYQRWTSPLFLAGESYGTTRAAGLAGHLIDRGIAFNGIILISTVMQFQTIRFGRGNDLSYALYVPTYAATAWYHNKLPADLQEKTLDELLPEVEQWAQTDYMLALMQGDRLKGEARQAVVAQLARYTGLTERYIEHSNLRVHIWRFCKELLRDDWRTVGRLDSRFKGTEELGITEAPEFDPSMASITPPYTATFNDYVRRELGYETDTSYEILSYDVNRNWEFDRGTPPDTSEALRRAFARNPFLKVFVAQGYYDLATPHFAAWYTFDHMGLAPEHHDNISRATYPAGHMFYLDVPSLAQFKEDAAQFIAEASQRG